MANIWARKSTAALTKEAAQGEDGGEVHLPKRTLSALNLVGLGIGCTIGAGIFVLTGHAAAENAGPAISLSFLFGAVACAFAGLCYAELSSTIPISGSAYTYAYATLGELIAWIIGWDLILEYAVAAVAVAIGWSSYVVSFAKDLGVTIPERFASSPLTFDAAQHAWTSTGAVLNIPAVAIILIITTLLVIGIRESAKFNDFIVALKLIVIALFIIFAVRGLQHRQLGDSAAIPMARSCRRTPAPACSAGPACCAAPPWCSLPMSASMRSRPRRRKPRRRLATCRSAFSVRW